MLTDLLAIDAAAGEGEALGVPGCASDHFERVPLPLPLTFLTLCASFLVPDQNTASEDPTSILATD